MKNKEVARLIKAMIIGHMIGAIAAGLVALLVVTLQAVAQ